jgi:nickel-dependent lactate racemase
MAEAVTISIPYGTGTLQANIPASNYLGTASPAEPLLPADSETGEVKRALARPIASLPLAQIVHAGDRVAIIVSDHTRPTPSGLILGPVLEELHGSGIVRENITIVVACGLHSPSPASRLQAMLGQDILERYRVVNHNADDEENLVSVGVTSTGIPVKINRIVAEADVRLAIGGIDPHRFAGWSGGAKNILPGVAARETVNAHHPLLFDAGTRLGVIAGNSFRKQLEEAAGLARLDFIVNVVLTPARKIAYAVAGNYVAAHRAGVEYVHNKIRVAVPGPADAVIASPGGAPRDGEFWQTEGKCTGPVSGVVKDGGTVIVAAQCAKGIGNAEFARYLRSMDAGEMEKALARGPFSMALAKAYEFAKLAERVTVIFITEGLDRAAFAKIPVRFAPSLEDALQQVLRRNPEASVLAVPDAAGVVLNVGNRAEQSGQ